MTETTPTTQPSNQTSTALWLLITASIIYIISWLMPAYVYDQEVRGYDAYFYTSKLIFKLGFEDAEGLWEKIVRVHMSLSPHTNYLIIIAIVALFISKSKLPGLAAYRIILIVSLLINLVWLYGYPEDMSHIGIGYYLWVISFILVIIATSIYISQNKK